MDNNYTRKEADDLLKRELRNLFIKNDMCLKEHTADPGEDNGTDFYFDVTDADNKHLFFFRNQNKGTFQELKFINKKKDKNFNKISYQISLRNAINYYEKFDEAIIFTLCDLKNKIIYWYDIQNDITLYERILKNKNTSKTIQIYIPAENVLNETIFNTLLSKIHYAKYAQIKKKRLISINLEADYTKVESEIENKHIIDKIYYVIKLFEGILVLPAEVICQLVPFKGTYSNTFINGFILYTDNEEFFDFMNTIILDNNELKTQEVYVENQKDKLKEIINFLNVNCIYHIRWRGKQYKNEICIHKLFLYKRCDCERCNLERLNIKRTKFLLKENLDKKNIYEALRKGYTYYLLGNYKNSIDVFMTIYNEADRTNNPINYTISTYNLIMLRKLIEYTYYKDDKNKILEKISTINFDIDEPFIKNEAPYFLDVFKNIKEKRFYEDVKYNIEKCFMEIQKIGFNDKYGGVTYSTNEYDILESSFIKFINYLEHNFIIFNHYSEYKELSKKVLESIFVLYTLKNYKAIKYEKFSWNIIEMWIFNVDEKYSKYLLEKYNIKIVKIEECHNISNRINELIDNLIESNEYLIDLDGLFRVIHIGGILSRIVMIVSILDIDFRIKEKIIFNTIQLCRILVNKQNIPYSGLINFVEQNENEIGKDLIKNILDLFFCDECERHNFGRAINIYVEKCSEVEIENLIKAILKINDLNEIKISINNLLYRREIFYSFTLLNDDIKKQFKEIIINKLNKEFDSDLFNLACIYGLIDCEKDLFEKFIFAVPDMSKSDRSECNMELGQVINLAFKYNIEFNDELKNLTKKSHKDYFDYYCWLMDIDNFDYSKFDPYWILEYPTVYYFERFKKSKKLIAELSKSLKENYIEGVAKMYFENLV
jgi:hypothetical protein